MLSLLCWFGIWSLAAGASCYDGGGNFAVAQWPHCVVVNPNLLVYSGLTTDGNFLKLGAHFVGHTKAWSALAFAGNGGMKGASQIVVRMVNDAWVAEDRFSLDYVTPTLDANQNTKLIFAADNGFNTSWGVLIPKNSCDDDDYAVEDASRTYLWAYGATHMFTQHLQRGQFHANLVSGLPPDASSSGTTPVNLRMNNAPLRTNPPPGEEPTNPYVCGIWDLRVLLPGTNWSGKVHVAKFAPVLDANSAQFVHHMVLFSCQGGSGSNFTHNQIIQGCQSMPQGCSSFNWVWAVGSQDVVFPPNVGMPIGEGEFFLAIQMHYYNPNLLPNIVDTSGVTLYISDVLRPIDAGLFQLNGGTSPGQRDDLAISNRFTLMPQLIVPKDCTNSWTGPLTMLGVFHHMHLVGVRQQIELARNGVNMGLLRNERMYDFKHQSLEESRIKTLLPGDEFKVTCEYDTSGKTANTTFGENTQNEMCWAAFMYYPAQPRDGAMLTPPILANASLLSDKAVSCKSQSQNRTIFQTNVSRCAELVVANPILFHYGIGAAPYTLPQWCNILSQSLASVFSELMLRWPLFCPPCGATGTCTNLELELWAQNTICTDECSQFSLSVWPDTTKTTTVLPTYGTICDQTYHFFNKNFPPQPTCTPAGDMTNVAVVKPITDGILATQPACPEIDIKNLLTTCMSTDFDLGANGRNSCRDTCRTVAAALQSKFLGTVPLPTPDQEIQCIKNTNFSNPPAGATWTQFTGLEARVRAGTAYCDGMLSPAAQHVAWSLASILALFLL